MYLKFKIGVCLVMNICILWSIKITILFSVYTVILDSSHYLQKETRGIKIFKSQIGY